MPAVGHSLLLEAGFLDRGQRRGGEGIQSPPKATAGGLQGVRGGTLAAHEVRRKE